MFQELTECEQLCIVSLLTAWVYPTWKSLRSRYVNF